MVEGVGYPFERICDVAIHEDDIYTLTEDSVQAAVSRFKEGRAIHLQHQRMQYERSRQKREDLAQKKVIPNSAHARRLEEFTALVTGKKLGGKEAVGGTASLTGCLNGVIGDITEKLEAAVGEKITAYVTVLKQNKSGKLQERFVVLSANDIYILDRGSCSVKRKFPVISVYGVAYDPTNSVLLGILCNPPHHDVLIQAVSKKWFVANLHKAVSNHKALVFLESTQLHRALRLGKADGDKVAPTSPKGTSVLLHMRKGECDFQGLSHHPAVIKSMSSRGDTTVEFSGECIQPSRHFLVVTDFTLALLDSTHDVKEVYPLSNLMVVIGSSSEVGYLSFNVCDSTDEVCKVLMGTESRRKLVRVINKLRPDVPQMEKQVFDHYANCLNDSMPCIDDVKLLMWKEKEETERRIEAILYERSENWEHETRKCVHFALEKMRLKANEVVSSVKRKASEAVLEEKARLQLEFDARIHDYINSLSIPDGSRAGKRRSTGIRKKSQDLVQLFESTCNSLKQFIASNGEDDLEEIVDRCEQERIAIIAVANEMGTEHERLTQELDSAKAAIREHAVHVTKKDNLLTELHRLLAFTRETVSKLEAEKKDLEDYRSRVELRDKKMEEALRRMKQRNEDLTSVPVVLDELDIQRRLRMEEKKLLTSRLENQTASQLKLTQDLNAMYDELRICNLRYSELETKFSELSKEVDGYRNTALDAKREAANLFDVCSTLHSDLVEVKVMNHYFLLQSTVKDCEIEMLKESVKSGRESVMRQEQLEYELSVQAATLAHYQREFERLASEALQTCTSSNTNIVSLSQTLAEFQEANRELRSHNCDLHHIVSQLRTKLDELRSSGEVYADFMQNASGPPPCYEGRALAFLDDNQMDDTPYLLSIESLSASIYTLRKEYDEVFGALCEMVNLYESGSRELARERALHRQSIREIGDLTVELAALQRATSQNERRALRDQFAQTVDPQHVKSRASSIGETFTVLKDDVKLDEAVGHVALDALLFSSEPPIAPHERILEWMKGSSRDAAKNQGQELDADLASIMSKLGLANEILSSLVRK